MHIVVSTRWSLLLGSLLAGGCVDLARPLVLHCIDNPSDPACVDAGTGVQEADAIPDRRTPVDLPVDALQPDRPPADEPPPEVMPEAPPDMMPTATCTDTVRNGTETDVDCGGSCTTKCALGRACLGAGDCQSAVCTGNVCVSGCAQGACWIVQYMHKNPTTDKKQSVQNFNIKSVGTTAVPLSQLTMRYWFDANDSGALQALDAPPTCDYAKLGCPVVKLSTVAAASPKAGATHYLEIGFTAGTLSAGAQTGEINTQFHYKLWPTVMVRDNDYSFDASKTTMFVDWMRVTLYWNGVLVWGMEP